MTDDNDAKAREIAHGLTQGYIGPDQNVIDMKAFYSALVHIGRNFPTRPMSLIGT
jgi:hypothetical protein